jgi:hypothetical protein
MNAQERSGTLRNAQERSGTLRNDDNVQDHGPKRSQNHGHGTVTVRSRFTLQKRKKHRINPC